MSKFELATKLHDSLCPKCNGRCLSRSFCSFTHNSSEYDWKANSANRYFLELAEKAEKIIAETGLSVDDFIVHAKNYPFDIPENVLQSMEKNHFPS